MPLSVVWDRSLAVLIALQPSAPLPVLPGTGFPVDASDASKAAAVIGGTPYLDLLKRYRDRRL